MTTDAPADDRALPAGRVRAPRQATATALSAGATGGAACFVVALLAELSGFASADVAASDVLAVVAALPSVDPVAWATLGLYIIVLTPAVGIGISAWEYTRIGERRGVAFALVVLGILAISLVAALLR